MAQDSEPRVASNRLLRSLGVVLVLSLAPTTCVWAQSISISNGSSYTSIFAGQSNTYRYVNGRYVIFTPLPPLGIDLYAGQSNAPYPFFSGASGGGVPAWYYGYPPYYGPTYLSPYRTYTYGPFDYSARPFYWPRSYYGAPLHEIARRIDPALVDMPAPRSGASAFYNPAPPPAPPADPPVDEAIVALQGRDYDHAANLFLDRADDRIEIEKQEADALEVNRSALRLHALALSGAGRFAEASVAFVRAYEEDPRLMVEPMLGRALIDGKVELRRIVTAAVRNAHTTNTPEAWRTVAYLMQAEGRDSLAMQMLARAGVQATPAPAPATPTVPGGAVPGGAVPGGAQPGTPAPGGAVPEPEPPAQPPSSNPSSTDQAQVLEYGPPAPAVDGADDEDC